MRICTTTIPFSGMKIESPLPLEPLNERLVKGSESGQIVFEAAPFVTITLTRMHGGIQVKGVVSGSCRQDCASCADPVSHEVVSNIDWMLQTASDRAGPEDEIDDPGVVFYEGDHVDLEDPLQEALILGLSPFWHPPRDEHDRCAVCKRDCSVKAWGGAQEGTASPFGALLQGAIKSARKS
jgi:uncharacterized metal-binding protein YceD (DUF177 family)